MTPLEAEIAVAVLGLDKILRGETSWTMGKAEDAAAFAKRARALVLKAITTNEPAEAEEPEFSYEDTRKLLEADGDEVERRNNAFYEAVPDDIQDDVHAAATRAIGFLQAAQPRRVTKTTARMDVSPPEPFELDRFARMWRVAVDPMYAVRSMASGSLDTVMVDALAKTYPAIYALVSGRLEPGGDLAEETGLLDEAIDTMRTRRGDRWDVTDDQDRQIKILLGEEPIDLDLANEFAAIAPLVAPPAPRAKNAAVEPTAELLPGQKGA